MSADHGYLAWLPDPEPALSAPAPAEVTSSAATTSSVGPAVIVVVGAHGGSGATVVSILLALALAADRTGPPVTVLDGTPIGGDLPLRAPAWAAHPHHTWHRLIDPHPPVRVSGSSAAPRGWAVLGRDRRRSVAAADLAHAVDAVRIGGGPVIVDAGASVGAPWFDSVAELADHVVLTVDDRPGAANAARPVLSALRERFGPSILGRSVHLVVASQRPGVDQITGPLTDALTGRLAGVHHLPYDVELATGIAIDPGELAAPTFHTATAVTARLHPSGKALTR